MSEFDHDQAWHDRRQAVLGGSDFGVLFNRDSYRSELYLWAEKTGRIERWKGNEATDRGQRLEAGVIHRWLTANDAELCESPGFLLGGEGWYGGHPDAFATLDGRTVCVEVKTTTNIALDPVAKFSWQCRTYLGLARERGWPEMEECFLYVATLDPFMPDDLDLATYETFVIKHDESVWQEMLSVGRAWCYHHVVNDVPPLPVLKDMDLLSKIWPIDNGQTMALDEFACAALDEIVELRNEIKWRQALLKWCLREAKTGTVFDEPEVQWRTLNGKRILKIFKK